MYSKAKIAGHPIHPMLVGFPIALYVATVAALLAFAGAHDLFWYRAAFVANVTALVMAVLALVFGAVDLFALPSRSMARTTGYKHAGFNVLTFVLFLISAIVMGANGRDPLVLDGTRLPNVGAPLVLGIIGVATLLVAGWYGWTLVQTHHVGIIEREPVVRAPGTPVYDDREEYVPPPREPDRDRQIPIRH